MKRYVAPSCADIFGEYSRETNCLLYLTNHRDESCVFGSRSKNVYRARRAVHSFEILPLALAHNLVKRI